MRKNFSSNLLSPKQTGLPRGVTTLVIQSLDGKGRIFVPGRRATPLQVEDMNEAIVSHALQATTDYGWDLTPEEMLGVCILTEGRGVPFFRAFGRVWPKKEVGGVLNLWARRKQTNHQTRGLARFNANLMGADSIPRYLKGTCTGLIFDIGATGATVSAIMPSLADCRRLIFSSPCTSLLAAQVFVKEAMKVGFKPKDLAIVANEGFLGLDGNGTFLSFQLPGATMSRGNQTLSELVYRNPRFCHIGAGGLAANWQRLFQDELRQDEKDLGELPYFPSLSVALKAAKLSWPESFGGACVHVK